MNHSWLNLVEKAAKLRTDHKDSVILQLVAIIRIQQRVTDLLIHMVKTAPKTVIKTISEFSKN